VHYKFVGVISEFRKLYLSTCK